MTEDFAERIGTLAEMIVERTGGCHNEEQTKQSLIQPVIHALGYDIFNPGEVVMEYSCDAPVLKARNGKPESVDYAIRIAGTLSLLIEAKAAGENLDRHGGQLARYFMSTECRHAVLTNGLEWRFFSDLDKDNVMDAEPYRVLDMRDLSADDIAFLAGFRKDRFSEDGLRSEAERAMYATRISDYITSDIIDNPSDEFVRLVLSHMYDGIKSAAVVARFRPMIKEEFDKCVGRRYSIRSLLVRETDKGSVPVPTVPAEEMPDGGANDASDGDGRATWGEASKIVASNAVSRHDEADGESSNDGNGITMHMRTYHQGTPMSYDATATYLGDRRCRLHVGSQCAKRCADYASNTTRRLRDEHLDDEGVVIRELERSISMVGTVVSGSTCDGTRRWKLENGRRIREMLLADEQSDAVTTESETTDDTPEQDAPTEISWPIWMSYVSSERSEHPFAAKARIYEDGTTVVEPGSVISSFTAPSLGEYAKGIREAELRKLAPQEDGSYVLAWNQEIPFNSASTAGAFVSGSSVNGNLVWRDKDGRRLGDLR